MGGAKSLIERLQRGETVEVRAFGQSMSGIIDCGALVRIRPVGGDEPLRPGDVVLCRVHGHAYLHLIRAVAGDSYLIGNNRGGINGWTPRQSIYGKLDAVISQ